MNTESHTPLISIITITYNAAEVIEPTLASLAAQTFRDFEHIVADGASKDGTPDIIRRLSTSSLVVSEPDGGLYDAMNKGLRRARGKYVLFLNAGDSLHSPDTLERYARAAVRDPDIIYADTDIVDSRRNFIAHRHLSVPDKLSFRSFARGMLVCHQAFMLRRKLAPEYDTAYRFSADYDWCVRALRQTTPERCANLKCVAIDYLADGLTDKNHRASLKERYRIMCRHYGTVPTALRHVGFAFRAALRRLTRHA